MISTQKDEFTSLVKKAFDPLEEDSDLQSFMQKANVETSVCTPMKSNSTISKVKLLFYFLERY